MAKVVGTGHSSIKIGSGDCALIKPFKRGISASKIFYVKGLFGWRKVTTLI